MSDYEKKLNMYRLGLEASYLAACALADRVPELNENRNLDELFGFCKFHSITAIVAMALELAWKERPAAPEQMHPWRQARDMAIRKNILLNAERERILSHLEAIGCWYMPLKGSLLQFDYPKFGMRQMSDNDILFNAAKSQEVHDFLVADGYEAVAFLQGNHDEYVKKPLYNMEMHRSLFMNVVNPAMASYYADVSDKLLKDQGNHYSYHFSHEDFYIFMTAHAYKHYISGGIGIRNLLDVYVYGQKHGDTMDWDYVEGELRKFDAWKFDVECRNLAQKLFSDPGSFHSWTDEEKNALTLYFTSGAFGTEERLVENRMANMGENHFNGSKLKYIWWRLFPSVDYLAEMEPVLRTKRWLAPLIYVKRLFSMLFSRRHHVGRELKNLLKWKK